MSTYKDFVTYFENVARYNKDILHTDSSCKFFQFGFDEFLNSVKTKLGSAEGYILVLEGYEFGLADGNSDNILKKRTAAIFIARKIKKNDWADQADAYDGSELIIDEIINLMREHKKNCNHPLISSIDLNSFDAVPVQSIDYFTGFRLMFNVVSNHVTDVDENKWVSTEF